jgi:hypothetical protein
MQSNDVIEVVTHLLAVGSAKFLLRCALSIASSSSVQLNEPYPSKLPVKLNGHIPTSVPYRPLGWRACRFVVRT